MNLSLFITCFNDILFPGTGRASVTILERLGHTVVFPVDQTCCGQIHYNTGYRDDAVRLVRRFADVFSDAQLVVSPSASCVGMVREHYPDIARASGDAGLERRILDLVPRMYELSELLVHRLGIVDLGAYYPHRVTLHATCHSLRGIQVGDAPLRLLRAVRGIDLLELDCVEECCGFGGTFAVKNAEVSAAMLADKTRRVVATGAEVCTAVDNSCLMHIGGGLARQRAAVRTVHLAEILASTEEAAPS